jgi:hypothetical protein
MYGKTRRGDHLYYVCQPAGTVPEGHGKTLWIAEKHLLGVVQALYTGRPAPVPTDEQVRAADAAVGTTASVGGGWR